MHTMDYIDAATTGTLSPQVLPIMDLKKILSHIEETLPPTLHLPVSSDHNNCQSTRFSLWIFLMEISQPIMTSISNTLVSHKMNQWQ